MRGEAGQSAEGMMAYGILPKELVTRPDVSPNTAHGPYGLVQSTSPPVRQVSEENVHPSLSNWNPPTNSTHNGSTDPVRLSRQQTQAMEATCFPASNSSPSSDPTPPGGSPFDIDSFLAANTPSSESSGTNTKQVPYRQVDSNSHNKSPPDNATFSSDANQWSVHVPTNDWMADQSFSVDPPPQEKGFSMRPQPAYIGSYEWTQDPQPPRG
jgi:hypothetical protein